MLLAKLLLYILYKCIVACIYSCHGSYLRIPTHIVPKPLLSRQKINNQAASNNNQRTLKRPRLEQNPCFSDEDVYRQDKNIKRSKRILPHLEIANTAYQPINIVSEDQPSIKANLIDHFYLNTTKGPGTKNRKINKKPTIDIGLYNEQSNKLLKKLPNTLFFRSLIAKINNDFDSPLSQNIIQKLDVLPRLKIPYTLLSNLLIRCNYLDSCDALLNKILVK